MANTIIIPDADAQLRIAVNKRARQSDTVLLDADQKFACVLIKLAPAVTPDDYPALKAALEGVAGIEEVRLLVDGQAPGSIPAGAQVRLYVQGQMRIEDIPGGE
jgi:hypothetical protein